MDGSFFSTIVKFLFSKTLAFKALADVEIHPSKRPF
jgi:hypothetical protein